MISIFKSHIDFYENPYKADLLKYKTTTIQQTDINKTIISILNPTETF